MSKALEAALAYAELGLPVFPVHGVYAEPGESLQCTCGRTGCKDSGKHPRTANGLTDATTDRVQIERWWSRWPDANIAIRTDGLCVVDQDVAEGKHGRESWAKLIATHGDVPATLRVRTGSGGEHIYLRGDVKCSTNAKRFGGDVDIRGRGGYVIAPPSRHKSGECYELISVGDTAPIADAPAWLVALANGETPTPSASGDVRAQLAGLNEAKPSSSVEQKLARLRDLPRDGGRLDCITETARHLAGDMKRRGVADEITRQSVRALVGEALATRDARLSVADPEYPGEKRRKDNERLVEWAISKAIAEDGAEEPEPAQGEARAGSVRLPYFEGDADEWLAEQPEPQWVCEELQLMVGRPNLLAGDPSAGKTWLAQHIEMCVTHGLPILGKFAVRQGAVGHINYDQSRFVTMRRYADLAAALGRPARGIRVLSSTDTPLDAKGAESALESFMSGLILCTIDSLRTAFPSLEENSSDSAQALVMLRRVSERTGCAVLLLHHLSKSAGDGEGTERRLIDRVRGSTAIVGAAGAILGLSSGKDQKAAKTLSCERSHEYARRGVFEPVRVRFERLESGGFSITTAAAQAADPEKYELLLEHKVVSVVGGGDASGLTANAIDRGVLAHYGRRPPWDELKQALDGMVAEGKLVRSDRNKYHLPQPERPRESVQARHGAAFRRALMAIVEHPTGARAGALTNASALSKSQLLECLDPLVAQGLVVREATANTLVFRARDVDELVAYAEGLINQK